MEKMFSTEGKFFRGLSRCMDLVVLNLLWILCCLPLVTAGAATTALHYVVMQMAKDEDNYPVRSFFRAFRENFVQTTVIWLSLAGAAAVLYFDFYYFGHVQNSLDAAQLLLFFAVFLLAAAGCYVFPILAHFSCGTGRAVKNALLMAIAHLPYTALLLLLAALPYLLPVLFAEHLATVLFLDLIIGFAGCSYVSALLFRRIFAVYEKKLRQEGCV